MDNCAKILNVLEMNAGREYRSPLKLEGEEAAAMERLYAECKDGEKAFSELVEDLASNNKMICSIHKSVLDGTRRRIRAYYWGELQDEKFLDSPESISVFAEKDSTTNDIRFRIALEIDGNRATKRDLENHNKLLNYPKEVGCVYALNDGAAKSLYFTEDINEAKQKINDGTAKKVQLCVIIPKADDSYKEYVGKLNAAIKNVHQVYKKIVK